MSKREVTDCCHCGGKDLKAFCTAHLKVGEQIDTASARTEDMVETVNLCVSCSEKAIAMLLNFRLPHRGYDQEFYKWVQTKIK